MKHKKEISIVLPHVGSLEPLKSCIKNVKSNTFIPYEIIVVADKPGTETKEYLSKEEGVKAIFNPEIVGIEPAFNKGLKVAKGDFLCFLATDVKVSSGSLKAMADTLDAEPSFGWVATPCEYTGFFVGCSMMTREAFEKVGLWDELYADGYGFSDDDYLRRMWKAGYKPHIIEGEKVLHKQSDSGVQAIYGQEEKKKRFARNKALFMQRYGENGTNWDNLPSYQPLLEKEKKMTCLNLGSFVDIIKDSKWENIDILPLREHLDKDVRFRQHDLRRGIPYPDNSVDLIRASHLIEHLTLEEAKGLLCEMFRVLKPNGLARITTPDLNIIIKHYYNRDMGFFNAVEQPAEYIQAPTMGEKFSRLLFSGDYQHKAIFTYEMIKNFLEQAGFTKIFKSVPGFSHSEQIQMETQDAHIEISLFVEVIK